MYLSIFIKKIILISILLFGFNQVIFSKDVYKTRILDSYFILGFTENTPNNPNEDRVPEGNIRFGFESRMGKLFQDIYFRYEQNSLWCIGCASAPFKSTDYMPRLFLRSKDGMVEYGWNHKSNGRGGGTVDNPDVDESSRVVDSWFMSLHLGEKIPENFSDFLTLNVNIEYNSWFNIGRYNSDINDYTGPWTFLLEFISENWRLKNYGRKGKKGGLFKSEIIWHPNKDAWGWMCQYSSGYGEEIFNYNKNRTTTRCGVRFGG